MENPCFQSPAWFHAATLAERVATLPAAPPITTGEVDTRRARRRLRRWQAQTPFSEPSSGVSISRRLAVDGITMGQLHTVLGEPIEAVQARHGGVPPWLTDLIRAFDRPFGEPHRDRAAAAGSDMATFLTAIEPLLGHARNSLREGIRALRGTRPALLFTTEPVEPELVQILQGRLFMMIGRTFALELNVARLQGRLHGDTPEDRFQSFLRQLGNHGAALALLLEYPAPAAVPAGRARLLAAARAIGDRLEALVDRLPPLIERDAYLDVIGGAAGGVGSLASLFRYAPSAPVLRAARLCGDRLVACARPMEHGVGWMLPQVGGVPLAGFSHGAAGMAWALLELAGLTGDDRYRSTAIAALDYERSLFSAVEGNWPDLRRQGSTDQTADDGGQSFMVAWYHGAPGIALARLRSLGHLDDPTTRAEIDAALTTTRTGGFGGNHSSCHGDLGNLEPLLHAARTLGSVHCRAEAEGMAAAILAGIGQDGPRCSAPLEVETPGLMSGLAGIGHGLLRAAAPDEVPSVLALAPPC